MRMRRKKNLDIRQENCGDMLICIVNEDKNFETAVLEKQYLDFKKLFGNENPLEIEIGCGKGQFIRELAKQNPDKNFLAIEKCKNVIVPACETAIEENIKNIIFMECGAEYLPKYIPDGLVENIYLNFSCPYPKKKYENHRLTNKRFLKIYKTLLKRGGKIFQKTDNMHFFEYSIEQFSKEGFALEDVSLDLHGSDFEGNILTEYEEKFSQLGQPIYRLAAYIK